jgi:hypothetical protein
MRNFIAGFGQELLKLAYDPFGKQTANSLGIPGALGSNDMPKALGPNNTPKPPVGGGMNVSPQKAPVPQAPAGGAQIRNPGLRSQVESSRNLNQVRQGLTGS